MSRAVDTRHRPLLWVRCGRILDAPSYRTCRRILAEGDIDHGPFTDIYPDHAAIFEDRTGHRLDALLGQITLETNWTTTGSRPHIKRTEYALHTQYGDSFRLQVKCKCGAAHKLYTRDIAAVFADKLAAGADLTRPVSISTEDL